MRRVKIKIIGDVQGVFFRYSAREEAEKLKLTGWIRNEIDGNVGIVIEGEDEAVQQFIDWCKIGPEMANVEDVQVDEDGETQEFDKFEVK